MTNPPAPGAPSALATLSKNAYLVLTLTALFWGGNVVAGKLAVGNIDPHALMILRWTGALLAVLPFAIEPLRRDWATVKQRWWLYLFFGWIGFATFNVCVYLASYLTTGVNIAIEQVAINIFVMLFNFTLFRTRVRGLQVAGVILTILGVALTATHGDLGRLLSLDINFGDVLMIGASFAYAIYSICLRWRPATHWMTFFVATVTGAVLASFAYQALLGGGPAALLAHLPEITTQGWLVAAYTVIFPSVISQIFYVRGVELIGSNRASLFVNLVPIFGTLGAVIVLGERLELFHMAAAALVIAGIVMAEWSARRG
jgi:drug/metabolite transporter (DMT)-like permease